MADFKVIQRKMSNSKLKLSDLNPHLMCVLCGGYYIDATTIVECLHSFCRSCIVKHLESSKYCPICEVQVHKTKPLINIRPDKTLQDIVYKLVPGLFASEMRNRRRFYRERPHYIKPNDSESSGEVSGERKIYVNDENITFSLVYHEGPVPTSVENPCREFPPSTGNEKRYFKCPTGVTVYHLKKLLRAKYELGDSNYRLEIYFRGQELHQDFTLLDISYVYLWKTKGTLDLTYKIFENVKRQKIDEDQEKVPTETSDPDKVNIEETVKKEERTEDTVKEEEQKKEQEAKETAPEVVKQPDVLKSSPPETAKENGVAGAEVKEVQLQISESGVMSVSQVEDSQIVRTVEETAAKVTNSQIITGAPVPVKEVKPNNGEVKRPEKKLKPYKTIRCSPKAWHPVIPKEKLRPTLMKNSDEPRKPLKFFKMRNMPRFLGNPSSGVKPMFTEVADKRPEKKIDLGKTANKILKIDPKTLRPIEKDELKMSSAPSAPNLLTNPFIPNNNHFLFSDLHLLPPNSGNYKNKPSSAGGFKAPIPNGGTYPPICFPTPDHSPHGFYPFGNLAKPQSFPFPSGEKMDPLLRAARMSPFGNLAGFNMAGFHASLPPSISRLLNPHHHFRKISQTLERRNKDESTKETTKRCDDSLKVEKGGDGAVEMAERETEKEAKKDVESRKREEDGVIATVTKAEEPGEGGGKKEENKGEGKEVNGETSESALELKLDNREKDRDKEKEKEKDKDS